MWQYIQETGELLHDWIREGIGYSGFEEGKNNPEMQQIHDVGPIPCGVYRIGMPFDSETHGPFAMRLIQQSSTETFGRDRFLMHGDSKEHPGLASHGCIIMARGIREAVAGSGDDLLKVIARPENA